MKIMDLIDRRRRGKRFDWKSFDRWSFSEEERREKERQRYEKERKNFKEEDINVYKEEEKSKSDSFSDYN